MAAMEIERKLNGFRASWRNKHVLCKNLSDQEFRLLEIIIDCTDWDKAHSAEVYGWCKMTGVALAEIWGKSGTTVGRKLRSLIKKGFVESRPGGLRVKDFYRYDIKKAFNLVKGSGALRRAGFSDSEIAEMQKEIAESQEPIADLQDRLERTKAGFGKQNLLDTPKKVSPFAVLQTAILTKSDLISSRDEFNPSQEKEEVLTDEFINEFEIWDSERSKNGKTNF